MGGSSLTSKVSLSFGRKRGTSMDLMTGLIYIVIALSAAAVISTFFVVVGKIAIHSKTLESLENEDKDLENDQPRYIYRSSGPRRTDVS